MFTRFLLVFLLITSSFAFAAEAEPDHADHQELRALLQGIEQAVNTAKYTDLLPYFHKKSLVTTVNQQVIKTPAGLEPYFKDWIGPGRYVKTLKMTLTADDLTEYYGAGNTKFGIVRGSGEEDYSLLDGRHLDMKTRWTSTVIKDTDGKWKILTLHIGANFYDNPIVAAIQASTKYYAAGGLVVGLLLGGLGGFLLLRRNKFRAAC